MRFLEIITHLRRYVNCMRNMRFLLVTSFRCLSQGRVWCQHHFCPPLSGGSFHFFMNSLHHHCVFAMYLPSLYHFIMPSLCPFIISPASHSERAASLRSSLLNILLECLRQFLFHNASKVLERESFVAPFFLHSSLLSAGLTSKIMPTYLPSKLEGSSG